MAEIIPVTRKVREYIYSGVDDSGVSYDCYDEVLNKYLNMAVTKNKSLVWVYQNMVLSGFGNYVDFDSDIYQASLMAFVDVISILNSDENVYLPFFEDMCILEGHLYDDMLFREKYGKVRKLDN